MLPGKAPQGSKQPCLQRKPVLGSTAHTPSPFIPLNMPNSTENAVAIHGIISPGCPSGWRQALAYPRGRGGQSKYWQGTRSAFLWWTLKMEILYEGGRFRANKAFEREPATDAARKTCAGYLPPASVQNKITSLKPFARLSLSNTHSVQTPPKDIKREGHP